VFDRRALDEARREGVLAAASDLFNRRGIGATRVEDVGAAIGLSKRAMFHHIVSKDALIDACIARATAFHLNLVGAAEASSTSRIEAYFTAIRDYIETVTDPSRTILVVDVGAGLVSQAGWLAMAGFHQQLTEGYRKIVVDGQRDGSIRSLPVDDVLPCVPSVINWVSGRSFPTQEERRHVATELATLVTQGVLC
jgi:AcrR family transcriptional regulator